MTDMVLAELISQQNQRASAFEAAKRKNAIDHYSKRSRRGETKETTCRFSSSPRIFIWDSNTNCSHNTGPLIDAWFNFHFEQTICKSHCVRGLIIVLFWVASFFPDLVLTFILSTLTAFILRPLVRFLEFRWNMRRGVAIGVVFLLVGGIVVVTLVETIPILISHFRSMYEQLRQFPLKPS